MVPPRAREIRRRRKVAGRSTDGWGGTSGFRVAYPLEEPTRLTFVKAQPADQLFRRHRLPVTEPLPLAFVKVQEIENFLARHQRRQRVGVLMEHLLELGPERPFLVRSGITDDQESLDDLIGAQDRRQLLQERDRRVVNPPVADDVIRHPVIDHTLADLTKVPGLCDPVQRRILTAIYGRVAFGVDPQALEVFLLRHRRFLRP